MSVVIQPFWLPNPMKVILRPAKVIELLHWLMNAVTASQKVKMLSDSVLAQS